MIHKGVFILKIESFQEASGNEAAGWAEIGHEKLVLLPSTMQSRFPRTTYSPNLVPAEHVLVEAIINSIQAVQPLFRRSLILAYYTALKTAPLVLLSGADLAAAATLGRLFAEAVVGQYSEQVVAISGAAWHDATGEGSYYRSLHERFSTMRCQAIAQEAATTANAGKAYFVSFDGLPANQIASHLDLLLADAVPQALALSAVIPAEQLAATQAHFPQAMSVRLHSPVPQAGEIVALPPPIGLQRLWLSARSEAVTTRSREDRLAA